MDTVTLMVKLTQPNVAENAMLLKAQIPSPQKAHPVRLVLSYYLQCVYMCLCVFSPFAHVSNGPLLLIPGAEFYPQQKSYTVATGTPFKLSVHAKHSKSCHWTYNVDATSPASSVIRTNENGVHIELDTAQKEAHYFNVEATDECGHTLTDTYNLFVLPEGVIPGFEESGAEEHYRDCTGGYSTISTLFFINLILYRNPIGVFSSFPDNHAPIFPRDSVSLSVVFDELLPLDFLAEDEDENDEIKYYVLQSTRGIVVSRNGKLR